MRAIPLPFGDGVEHPHDLRFALGSSFPRLFRCLLPSPGRSRLRHGLAMFQWLHSWGRDPEAVVGSEKAELWQLDIVLVSLASWLSFHRMVLKGHPGNPWLMSFLITVIPHAIDRALIASHN